MKVTTAKTLDDFMKVMVLRGVVFMGEQNHKYTMEFDEYELNNRTHLLAYEGDEPIGTMRILKDGKDAKFERLALLPEYRGKGYAEKLIEAGYEYCRREEVDNVYLFCKPELFNYWKSRGYQKVYGNNVLSTHNMFLVPVAKSLNEEAAAKLNTEDLPQILKHQEGEWLNSHKEMNMALIIKNKLKHGGKI